MKFCCWLNILITMSLCQDVCPSGHLFLGLASLAPLLVPGLMYSLTTFLHYQGDIMQCGVGKPFNIPSSKLGEAIPIIPPLPQSVFCMRNSQLVFY